MSLRAAPVLVLICALARAEEAAGEKPTLTFELDADVSGAWRSKAVERILERDPGADSEAYLAPRLTIRATATLPKGVRAVVELENPRLRADLFDTDTWGSAANRDLARGDDLDVFIEQAYVRIDPLFWRELSFKAGLMDFRLALRGPGDAFFCDLQESEFALVSPVTESVVQGSLYGAAPPEGTDPATAGLFRDTTQAGGFRVSWNMFYRSLVFLDAFYFTALEGGIEHRDERIFGLNLDVLIPFTEESPSLVNVLAACIQNDDTGSRIWTLGLGADFRPMRPEGLSVYLEAYWQSGLYAEPADHRIRQSAYAGRAGARVPFASLPGKPWIDASFWVLTGDRGDPDDHVNRDFVSYEGIDEALVVEDDLHGLDIDSNYFGPRLRVGFEAKAFSPGDLRFEFLYAYFRLWREPEKAGGAAELDPGRRLGHEVDLRVSLDINERATLTLFGGALLDSQWLVSSDAYDTHDRDAWIAGLGVRVEF